MDLEMLIQLHQQHQIYMLNANQIFEYQTELSRYNRICEHLDQVHRQTLVQSQSHNNSDKPLTSFKIKDILSNKTRNKETDNSNKESESSAPGTLKTVNSETAGRTICDIQQNKLLRRNIVRPWSTSPRLSPCPSTETSFNNSDSVSEEEIDVENLDDDRREIPDKIDFLSPLDALMEMSNKTFRGLQALDSNRTDDPSMLNKSQLPKKKRKTRTAFSNQQIYELEKRFLYQKYLTPADRDEIAGKLGLSCAQVITWFQNRRAKFKRDIEEMKNDVGAVSSELTIYKCTGKNVRD